MKLETLARRLAQRLQSPELETCILERRRPEISHCLEWPGKKSRSGLVRKHMRDHNGRPYIHPIEVSAFGLIRFEGKEHYVHRLIYALTAPEELKEFRLKNVCGNTLCANPNHWLPMEVATPPEPEPEPILIADPDEDWTLDEAVEILEMYLETRETLDFEDPLLIDAPRDLIREALIGMGKAHLLPDFTEP